jgi:hypothetical protein
MINGEAEFLHHYIARGRRAKALDAEYVTAVADVTMPA